LISCNKESIEIEGELINTSDDFLVVKIKSISGNIKKVINTLEVKEGVFNFYSNEVKLLVNFCFQRAGNSCFEI
jgi:hypothetical protein